MSLEETLTRALHAEADTVEVDVARLHAATRDRLVAAPRRRRTTVVPVLVAASLLVVALVAAGLAIGRLGDGISRGLAPADHRGHVDTTFSCPGRVTVDRAGTKKDDSFLPDIELGGAEAARMLGAQRFALSTQGDQATLRLGNADGTLASQARFQRVDGHWRLEQTTKCAGDDGGVLVPDANPLRLGVRDATPYPAKSLEVPDRAVLVDDRSFYDASGLERHRTIWASPCERQVCLTSGQPGSMVVWTPDHPGRPEDVGSVFLPPDDTVGRPVAFGLWTVFDPDGTVGSVHGGGVTARRIEGPGWSGPLYVLLARKADTAAITMRLSDGGSVTTPTSSIR